MNGNGFAHDSVLEHANHRYLKVSLLGLVTAVVGYALTRPPGGGDGGTAFGSLLGFASSGLVVWLMWLGIRKRHYAASGAPLRGWVSAHVYLGALVVALVPLHAGFQFGANVHTLAYALLTIVVFSGIVGILLYGHVPGRMTDNRRGENLTAMLTQIEALDGECRAAAAGLPDAFAEATAFSIAETRIGGSLVRQLRGGDRATPAALARVRAASHGLAESDRERVKQLIGLLALKQETVERVERDVRWKAWLELWLLVHVPFSFATVAAIAAHVLLVCLYR